MGILLSDAPDCIVSLVVLTLFSGSGHHYRWRQPAKKSPFGNHIKIQNFVVCDNLKLSKSLLVAKVPNKSLFISFHFEIYLLI